MSDIAVVGRFAGPLALGSVGSTAILVTMFTGFLIGLAGGINVLTALYLGAGKKQALSHTVHSALIVSICSGLALLLFGICFARPVLEILHTKEELIDGSVLYLRIYFLGMPALAVYNCGNAIFSADGDTARPVRYLLLAGVLNVIMNLFFVVICKMDVAGVATASAISQYVSAGLILRDLFCINTDYRLHLSKLRPGPVKDHRHLKDRYSFPGLQNAIFALANLFVQVGVNSFSATMVAGNSAAANSDGLIYDVRQLSIPHAPAL